MGNIPPIYPASQQRDANLSIYGYPHISITHDSVAFVYDFVLKDLNPAHDSEDFIVKLSDVWGYTIEGNLQSSALNAVEEIQMRCFPNPTTGEIKLTFNANGIKHINVIDLSGNILLNETSENNDVSMDLKFLSSGFYIVQVAVGNQTESIKIVIE